MDVIKIMETFPTQEDCIAYLERLRWQGFWSFVKRAWYGSHHHYSTAYTPLYLTEACYKYNYRHENIFAKFLTESMSGEI